LQRRAISSIFSTFLSSVFEACLAINARCQSLDAIMNSADKAHLDLAVSQRRPKDLKKARRTQTEPKVLVIDYFHGSAGTSSRLSTLLADRFSESLGNFSNGMRVLDRNILEDF
jgi:hypothetical protein